MRPLFSKTGHSFPRKATVAFLSVWYVLLSSHLVAFLCSEGVPTLQSIRMSEQGAQHAEAAADDSSRLPLTHEDHSSSGSFLCMMCDLDIFFTAAFELPTASVPSIRSMKTQLLYRLDLFDHPLPELFIPDSILKIPILHG